MNEKDMMNDYLSMINGSLTTYAGIIAETDNPQLRQTLQQMRNQDEARQFAVYNIAKQKGYYKPAAPAQPNQIQQVQTELNSQ